MKKDLMKIGELGGGVLFKYKNIRIINMLESKRVLKNVIKGIDKLPKEAIYQMQKKDILIRLEKASDYEKLNVCENSIGFFNIENIIYIKEIRSRKLIQSTIIHEVGHFIDRCLSLENKFKSIEDEKFHNAIENECEYLLNEYGKYYVSNILEVFAQSFYAYIDNKKFFKNCPKISGAIEDYVKQLALC